MRKGKEKISDQALFQVGGITKTFTAKLILQAIQAHQLSYDDPLGKFLHQYSKWKKITIAELVNQTSVIPNYDQSKNWVKRLVYHPTKV